MSKVRKLISFDWAIKRILRSKANFNDNSKDTLDYLKMPDEERLDYNQYQKILHDQASAYESTYVIGKIEGKKEGIEENTLEIAKKSLEQNIDLETIKIITGLTDADLSNLTNTRNE